MSIEKQPVAGEITQLLVRSRDGDDGARNLLWSAAYDELKKIAAAKLRGERQNHSLQPSALVNEAFLKLAGLTRIDWQNRSHFFGIAARVMRQILVDHARARLTDKRGGDPIYTELDPAIADKGMSTDVLAVNEALESLARKDARAAQVVECRYFAGLSIEETAAGLGIAPRTVKRDWQIGRAWMKQHLSRTARNEGEPAAE